MLVVRRVLLVAMMVGVVSAGHGMQVSPFGRRHRAAKRDSYGLNPDCGIGAFGGVVGCMSSLFAEIIVVVDVEPTVTVTVTTTIIEDVWEDYATDGGYYVTASSYEYDYPSMSPVPTSGYNYRK
jgi:hypothetical protein